VFAACYASVGASFSSIAVHEITNVQVQVCRDQVAWAKAEKRAFLRQRIELRLAALFTESKQFQGALELISTCVSG
jgi:26S proteasome regulatory subunit N6